MMVFSHYAIPALTYARSALQAARTGALLLWAALWYAVGWCIGLVVRVGLLGGVACIQGFADATGWGRVLVWLARRGEDT